MQMMPAFRMPRLKRFFLLVSVVSLVIGIGGFVAWSRDLLPSVGEHGKNWDRWQSAITVTWTMIQIAFPASAVSAVIYMTIKPRSKSSGLVGGSLLVAAVAVSAWIIFVMGHLGIQ
jgi:hypothetical protein